MSTNRSVGRLTAAQAKGRSASTQEKVRSATTNKVGHFTATSKKDRSRLCAFTFADGRQCRTPRCSGHLHLCYFHAQKEAESLVAQQVGKDISRFLPVKLLTACDLGVAMSRLFCAVAQGQVKPKVAATLAYLAQTMLQSIPIAQDEYIHSFDTNAWRREIRSSFNVPAPQPRQAPHPTSQPAPMPRASASAPPTPLEARPVYPVHPEPRREPGSSASSSSTSSPAPQPPVNCHSERSEEPAAAAPSNSPLTTRHFPKLLYLPRAPNSFSRCCPGGIYPGPVGRTAVRTLPLLPPLPPTLPQPARSLRNPHLHRLAHRPLRPTRNLRPLRSPRSSPHHSNPSQLRTRNTTRYLHQRRPFPRLCHPVLVPPPTGTS